MARTRALLTVLLLAFPALALAPGAEAAEVTTASTTLPQAMVGASAVYLDGATYLFGGRLAGGSYSSQVLRHDHASGLTEHVADFPATTNAPNPGRYSGAAVAMGGKIYYFGGAVIVDVTYPDPDSGEQVTTRAPKSSADIFEFDPSANTMRRIGALPRASWGHAAVVHNGVAYIFGGFEFDLAKLVAGQDDGARRHDIIVTFNPTSSDQLDIVNDRLPYPVQDGALVSLGSSLYYMAGLSEHDPSTNPCPVGNSGNQITVCLTKNIIRFNPNTRLVVGVVGEMPYATQFVSAAKVGDDAYVTGGRLGDDTAAFNIVKLSGSGNSVTAREITPVLPTIKRGTDANGDPQSSRGLFGHSVVSDGSLITLFGGRWGRDDQLSADIIVLDPRATIPWAPRSPVAAPLEGGLRLSWTPPSYDGGAAVTAYNVYRQALDGDEQLLATTPSLAYDDTSVAPGAKYTYRIRAVNSAGEGDAAKLDRSADATPPGPVTALQAYGGNGQVVLRWGAPTSTGGSDLTGYRVHRDGELLATLLATETEFVDDTVTNGQTYTYAVVASNAKGGGNQVEVIAAPKAVPAAPTSPNAREGGTAAAPAVELDWFAPNDAITHYVIKRGTSPTDLANLSEVAAGQTTYTDTDVMRGRTYHYTISAVNNVGTSPPSDDVAISLVNPPGAPTGLQAIPLEGGIRLSWTPPTNTGDAPADVLRYYVKRDGTLITSALEGTSYTDRRVTPGQTYDYAIVASNPKLGTESSHVQAAPADIIDEPPTAILAVLPSHASPGDPVEVDGSQSTDDGTIATYVFDFGDASPLERTSEPTVHHTYLADGLYTATLKVIDDAGQESTLASFDVLVGEPEQTKINTNPGLGGTTPGGDDGQGGTVKPPGSETPAPAAWALLASLGLLALARRR